MQYSLRWSLIGIAIVCVALATVLAAKYCAQEIQVEDAAGDLVVDYLMANGDVWPSGWQGLEPFTKHSFSIGEFQRYVTLDFQVDVDELRRRARSSNGPGFNLIRGRGLDLANRGDRAVWHYLLDSPVSSPLAPGAPE
jgi:hypothetical protein